MLLPSMHELSIAMSIVEGALEEACARRLGRVEAVHLKLGALSGVVKDALLFSYEAACRDTALQGSRLSIQEVPVTLFCPACQCERQAVGPQELRCLICGEASAEIVRGRELQVVALELSYSENSPSEGAPSEEVTEEVLPSGT
jgi:hydrogenase nickel incorporation protein HypA/HybF